MAPNPPGGVHARSHLSSAPQNQAPPPPRLLLDSGAALHVVGDQSLLSNIRDAPAGKWIRVAGDTLPVTKVGDITRIAGFRIPGVHLAPGLKYDIISVRVLTRSSICKWFDGDRATLYAGSELVGVAVAPKETKGLYVLQYLRVPKGGVDGEMRLLPVSSLRKGVLPVWCGFVSASFGSVLCWLKGLLRRRLFSEGHQEKPRERRRKKRKNSGRRKR